MYMYENINSVSAPKGQRRLGKQPLSRAKKEKVESELNVYSETSSIIKQLSDKEPEEQNDHGNLNLR